VAFEKTIRVSLLIGPMAYAIKLFALVL